MKKLFLIISIGFALVSCNSGTDSTVQHTDSTHQEAEAPATSEMDGQNHMKAMHDAMSNMMQKMESMKHTGDPDVDFAMMMKHHHEGAIEMSKAEIGGGTDAALKQLAQKMIDEQQKDNAAFDKFIKEKQPLGTSDYGQKAMGMMTAMSDIKMEGSSLDAMFASMMIPHHQDAVKMANAYLKVGKSEEIKEMARKIAASQPKEIEQLKQFLNRNKTT